MQSNSTGMNYKILKRNNFQFTFKYSSWKSWDELSCSIYYGATIQCSICREKKAYLILKIFIIWNTSLYQSATILCLSLPVISSSFEMPQTLLQKIIICYFYMNLIPCPCGHCKTVSKSAFCKCIHILCQVKGGLNSLLIFEVRLAL